KLKKEKKKQSAMKKWSRLFKVWQKCVVTRSRIKDCRTGGHCLPGACFEQNLGYHRGPSGTAQFLRSGPPADSRMSHCTDPPLLPPRRDRETIRSPHSRRRSGQISGNH